MVKRLSYILIAVVATLIVAAILNPLSSADKDGKKSHEESRVVVKLHLKDGSKCGVCIEIADTYQKRETGLSVSSLWNCRNVFLDEGSLFPYRFTIFQKRRKIHKPSVHAYVSRAQLRFVPDTSGGFLGPRDTF